MKALFLALTVFATSLLGAAPAVADTLAYPDASNASFVIDYPKSWEMVPGEELGDYVTLNAPTGAVLQLRTIPGTDTAMDVAIEDSVNYLNQTFTNVKLGEPQEIDTKGLTASLLIGKGVDTEQQEVGFAMYFIALPDGNIAEIWYAVVKGDDEGNKAAVKILDSFRMP